jgi:hypothetical protein
LGAVSFATLSGCLRNFFLENTETTEDFEEIKSYVNFINDGDFAVDVFADPSRESKLCSVPPHGQLAKNVVPNSEANYYLIYHITFHGVTLPYTKLSMLIDVERGKTTNGHIPLLTELSEAAKQEQLAGDAYLFMKNKSSFPIRLQRGNTPINPNGSDSSVLSGKREGLYILLKDQLVISNYTFSRLATTDEPVPWPAEITALTNFEKSYLYSFEFGESSLSLIGKWEMTLANALGKL